MSTKIGETPILRGQPPVMRTLEVFVDEDWLRSEQLEKCVSFQESSLHSGKVAIVFSRSISAVEARAFAELLMDAVAVLESSSNSTIPTDSEPEVTEEGSTD